MWLLHKVCMLVTDVCVCVCVCTCCVYHFTGPWSEEWKIIASLTDWPVSYVFEKLDASWLFPTLFFFIRHVFEGSLARSLARPLNITRTRSLRAPLKLLIRHAGILSDSRVSAREYDEINNLTTNSGTTPIERSSNDDPNDRRRRVELLKDLVERRILFEKILWFKDFSFSQS